MRKSFHIIAFLANLENKEDKNIDNEHRSNRTQRGSSLTWCSKSCSVEPLTTAYIQK